MGTVTGIASKSISSSVNNGTNTLTRTIKKHAQHTKRKSIKAPVKEISNKYQIHCAYGGDTFDGIKNRATGEHVKLFSKGGSINPSNILPVCEKHNSDRANVPLKDFLKDESHNTETVFRTLAELKGINEKTKHGNFNGADYVKNMVSTLADELGINPKIFARKEAVFEKNHPQFLATVGDQAKTLSLRA